MNQAESELMPPGGHEDVHSDVLQFVKPREKSPAAAAVQEAYTHTAFGAHGLVNIFCDVTRKLIVASERRKTVMEHFEEGTQRGWEMARFISLQGFTQPLAGVIELAAHLADAVRRLRGIIGDADRGLIGQILGTDLLGSEHAKCRDR